MYLDALQKDQRYGPAYYRLGLTALKIGPVRDAVNAFRRAIELLPATDPDHWDSRVKVSEIYLLVAREQKQFLDEVEDNCKKLLKRDPNSFDGQLSDGRSAHGAFGAGVADGAERGGDQPAQIGGGRVRAGQCDQGR